MTLNEVNFADEEFLLISANRGIETNNIKG
jgi:hypothetical protein